MTLSRTSNLSVAAHFPTFDWIMTHTPNTHPKCPQEAYTDLLRLIKENSTNNTNNVAAVIIEGIFGAGGDIHPPVEFYKYLREVCTENNILLVFDEIQSGLGITGKMWSFEHYGITPDIVCFGKKAQVCGIMCTTRLDEVQGHVFADGQSRIDSTWGGNLTDMVRAQRYLEIIEEDNLIENAANKGQVILEFLKDMQGTFKNTNLVSNVRGRGLMCAFDLPDSGLQKDFLSLALQKKLLILPCGESSIRLRPSLTFNESECEQLQTTVYDILETLNKIAIMH